jgi:hypothetical protein
MGHEADHSPPPTAGGEEILELHLQEKVEYRTNTFLILRVMLPLKMENGQKILQSNAVESREC